MVSIFAPLTLTLAFLAVTVMGLFVSLSLIVNEYDVFACFLGDGFTLELAIILEEMHVGVLAVEFVFHCLQFSDGFTLHQLVLLV